MMTEAEQIASLKSRLDGWIKIVNSLMNTADPRCHCNACNALRVLVTEIVKTEAQDKEKE
jgi:hypothetical protein